MALNSRLIIVEGIPGSGKTTMAAFIKSYLDRKGMPARLYCEGDLKHPADYESVAHFSRDEYAAFLAQHATHRALLEHSSVVKGDDIFFHYRQMKLEHAAEMPDDLVADLSAHDVYETPDPATYCRLALRRWRAFVETARQLDEISIFECCFLQNPLAVLIIKHNLAHADAIRHISKVAALTQPLEPIVVYLWQADTRKTLEQVAQTRPKEWRHFVIAYTEQGAWGKATGAVGFDAFIAFHELRRSIELDLLRRLNTTHIVVDNSDYDWDRAQRACETFLGANLPQRS